MTLSLPPSSAPLVLPDTIKFDTVQRSAVLPDDTRVDVAGNTRVTVDGDIRIVWNLNPCYPQVLGQVPNMTRRLTLPE